MKKFIFRVPAGLALGLVLCSPAVLATQEEVQDLFNRGTLYLFLFLVACVAFAMLFVKTRDKRGVSLDSSVIEEGKSIHSVAPDTPVIDCVRLMSSEKIGALIVVDGETLLGIFTERDALNRVLAVGLDASRTKISEVMTRDPYCVSPKTSIREAMEVVTQRRFRHLPVVEDGKVRALVSSGDLIHWLVKDQLGEVRQIVDLAAQR